MYRGLLLLLLLSSACGISDLFWSRKTTTTVGPEPPAVAMPLGAGNCPPAIEAKCKTEAHMTCSCGEAVEEEKTKEKTK